MKAKTVLFVCVHNAGRSQMAEAITNHLASQRGLPLRARSAGTVGGKDLNPLAVAAMEEIGIPMTGQRPKLLTPAMVEEATWIISMGCGVDAEACPAKFLLTEDWELDDPAGQSIEAVRAIRDAIVVRVTAHLDSWVQTMSRRYLAEGIGAFLIVFAPVALSAANLPAGASAALGAVISGLAVLVMIYTFGPLSGAHFNPAVTLGLASAGRFPWRFVAPYWLSQVLGGVVAAGLSALLFGAGHGVHIPALGPEWRAMLTEVVLTFFLMLVIMAVATDRRVPAAVPGVAIGLMVIVGVLIGGPISGGSMNPARSLGPALFGGPNALSVVWIYLLFPSLGAVLAAWVYEGLRLQPDLAKNVPDELSWDLRT